MQINECGDVFEPAFTGTCSNFSVSLGNQCQLANPCASNPCANGGQCDSVDTRYRCTCTPFFTGQTCKQDVNECDVSPSPCKNGGVCINEVGGYRCQCPPEYTGKYCESRYMPCNPSPCHNGGTCIQKGETSYECSCVPGTNMIFNFYRPSPKWRRLLLLPLFKLLIVRNYMNYQKLN